ncbi:MAG: hypothetical protein NVS2B3_06380 [Vulcanimicrobiaceae bacterium]
MLHALAVAIALATPAARHHAPRHPTVHPSPAAAGSPAPTQTPAPAPMTAASRARAMFDQIRANAVDRTLLTRTFSSELTPEIVTTLARSLQPLGEPTHFVERAKHVADGVTSYDYTVAFATGALSLTMGIDDATNTIARFYVRRATGGVAG